MLTIHDSKATTARPPAPAAPARPGPGLTVLIDPTSTLPLAGYLLRHGSALALERAPLPMASFYGFGGTVLPSFAPSAGGRYAEIADQALEATINAGFDARAAETYFDGDLDDRLGALAGDEVACVVVATTQLRKVRAVARAAGAPVLALPSRGEPAGGPAIVEARDAEAVLPTVAQVLATDRVVLVGGYDTVRPHTVLRTAHPAVAGQLHDLARDMRREEIERARQSTEDAAARTRAYGLVADTLVLPEPHAVITAAEAHEGIVVAVDRGSRRAPALLREALAENRACLLVPAP